MAGSLYNLWMAWPDGTRTYSCWALFALLLLVSLFAFLDIFLYRRRALQMRVASFLILILVGWYAAYGIFVYLHLSSIPAAEFRPYWTASFPFAAIVCLYLAFRGILRDEQLVRSLDRLR